MMRQPTGVNVTGQHGGPGEDPKLPGGILGCLEGIVSCCKLPERV